MHPYVEWDDELEHAADAAWEALNPSSDHAHQFVAERCLVCGCGEPEADHGKDLPTMPRDPALRLTITACPDCGRTVSEPDGAWYISMTCPDCGHVFTAQDETAPALAELRAFRADILRAMEY